MGYLRFFLVLAVIHGHFVGDRIFWQHYIAVIGFFTLSGFLITRIVCEIYRGMQGKKYFLINRFVRIYPTYWTCLFIAAFITYYIPTVVRQMHPLMVIPSGWQEWMPQFTIVGLNSFSPQTFHVLLLPTAWSLSTEIIYYLIIGLLIGQSRLLCLMAFSGSMLMVAALYLQHASFEQWYFTMYGPAPVFFLGSLAYHYRHLFIRLFFPLNALALLYLANAVLYLPDLWRLFDHHPALQMPVLHFSALCFALMIASFYENNKAKSVSKMEQFCADISYPMFLLHWPLGVFFKYQLNIMERQGHELFFAGLAATLIVSACVVFLVEIPTKKIRRYFRERAMQRDFPPP